MPVKQLQCMACGNYFMFTESEQEYFKNRGFFEPKRCPDCRVKKKENIGGDGSGNTPTGDSYNQGRKAYHVNCFACGCKTTVYFRPSLSRPAFCEGCDRGRYKRRGR